MKPVTGAIASSCVQLPEAPPSVVLPVKVFALLYDLACHLACEMNYLQLAGHPPLVGFCYGELYASEWVPANFEVCKLVAMKGSCYNDNCWTSANQTS